MGWLNFENVVKSAKTAFTLGQFARGVFDGSKDEIFETFTDAQMTKFQDTADLLRSCQPWEQHLKEKAYSGINKAIRKNDYQTARNLISLHKTETAAPWCITALKTAMVDACTKCTTLIKEALPEKIIVP